MPCPDPLDWTGVPGPELLGSLAGRLPAALSQGKLPSAERIRKCPGVVYPSPGMSHSQWPIDERVQKSGFLASKWTTLWFYSCSRDPVGSA